MTQSGYHFAQAMTEKLSWHMQNYNLIESFESHFFNKK